MDEDFCREQVQRIHALAERADPFTRRRLLALVGRYDAKAGPSCPRGSRSGRCRRAPRRRHRSSRGLARHDEGRCGRDQVRRRLRRIIAGALLTLFSGLRKIGDLVAKQGKK